MSSEEARQMTALLRRMAGMAGGGASEQRKKMTELVKKLSSMDDSDQYMALMELCESLNMATEDVLMAMQPDKLVPPILVCLQKDYNPELMLLASRSLTYLIDAIPPTAGIVAQAKGIPVLCDKLRNIVDIDVAEQALTALDKMATEIPSAVLTGDAIPALLGFVDFFSISTQRKAIAAVANVCSKCTQKTFSYVESSLPLIHNYIQHEDVKMVESALTAIHRILNGIATEEELVIKAFGDLTPSLTEILDKRAMDSCFSTTLKIIGAVVQSSPQLSVTLLEFGLMHTLQALLEHGTTGGLRSPALGATPSPTKGGPADSGSPLLPAPSPLAQGSFSGISTPPSTSRLSTGKVLLSEQLTEVCAILTRLLPPVQEDYMLYWTTETAAHLAVNNQALFSGTGDEEEEEPELDDEEVKERLTEMIGKEEIEIKNDDRHKSCKIGTHVCDFCGADCLQPGDWFRCNELDDFDLCARCVVDSGAEFCEEGSHTLSDMAVVFGAPPPSSGGPAVPRATVKEVALPERERTVCKREALFNESPDLLDRVCEGVGTVVRICGDSEDVVVRAYALDYIARLVTSASSEKLHFLLRDVSLCECLRASFEVGDSNPQLLPPLCYVTKVLLEKLDDIYHDLFVREGVVHALTKMKVATKGETSPTDQPLHVACATQQGWSALLARRSGAILTLFQEESSNKVIGLLETLGRRLVQGELSWPQGLREFSQIYNAEGGVSTFELVSGNVITDFTEALRRHPNPTMAIIDMFCILSLRPPETEEGGAPPSTLLKLVRQLQAILGQFENFPRLTTGGLRSVSSQIRLKIVPDEGMKEGEKEKDKDKDKKVATANVNIEPLATIGAVADFIQNRLLGASSTSTKLSNSQGDGNNGGDGNAEDDTEEILPEDPNKGSKKKRATTQPAALQVYIRFKDQGLSERLSMVQVMKRYVEPKKGKHNAPAPKKALPPGLPKHLQEAFLMATSAEEIELHYSTKPFADSVKPPVAHKVFQDVDVVHLDFKSFTHGASQIVSAISGPLGSATGTNMPSVVKDCLQLLRTLYGASSEWSSLVQYCHLAGFADAAAAIKEATPIPTEEFVNPKLNNKLTREVTNPLLAGQLEDSWSVHLIADCPFLFTAATRKLMFDVTYHGTARALTRIQERQQDQGEGSPSRAHRMQRLKMRVWRDRILESAKKIDELHGTSRFVFEMEYYGEEGSGLGPTQEFYSLLGKELSKRSLQMWRAAEDDNNEGDYCTSVLGFYPQPRLSCSEAELANFKFMGRMMARSFLDRRILNLRLSRPMLKLIKGDPLVLDDIAFISPSLFEILVAMISATNNPTPDDGQCIQLNGKNTAVDDLGLSFVLSGLEEIPLGMDGADRAVTADNMKEYVEQSMTMLLRTGVKRQVEAFRQGFDELMPLRSLQLLELEDISLLLSGADELVTMADLEAYTLQDHGFTPNSPAVRMFFESLVEMTLEEQKAFFQFLTGSPRLPVGGLAALRPKLTIVRKTSSSSSVSETSQLPSAMTCQNFLKLPAYESKSQLKEKLMLAINEGHHGFNFT